MNYFSSEDMDCVCYIEEDTNNVVIKFFGMANHESAELFTIYVMNKLGFEYNSINYDMPSKSVH
jgi:predicted aldo/keto reductase-like oxidoreductase